MSDCNKKSNAGRRKKLKNKRAQSVRTEFSEQFTYALSDWMDNKGLLGKRATKRDFARVIGADPSLINYWMNGRVYPSMGFWEPLKRELGLDLYPGFYKEAVGE